MEPVNTSISSGELVLRQVRELPQALQKPRSACGEDANSRNVVAAAGAAGAAHVTCDGETETRCTISAPEARRHCVHWQVSRVGGYTLPDGKWIVYRTEPQRQPPLRGAWTGADIAVAGWRTVGWAWS